MGKVLDVYWHCAEPGDNYSGHVSASLGTLVADFNVFPPHFNANALFENTSIHRAMELMHGPIYLQWEDTPQNPTGLLLRVLASVVHHFDWIKTLMRKSTDHPFNAILLVFHRNLVDEVKVLVTAEKSSLVALPTSNKASKSKKMLEISTTCLELLQNQAVDIKQVRMCDLLALFFK